MYSYIKLDKNIDCNYICKLTQELISKYSQSNQLNSDSILIIEIKNITDHEENSTLNIGYTEDEKQ
jgi:hypothetical protein